jgi:hypothetical protein
MRSRNRHPSVPQCGGLRDVTPMLKRLCRPWLLPVLMLLPPLAQAQLTFQFNYTDTGVGFNDPTIGAIRRGAFESAAGVFSSRIQTASPVTVTVNVSSFVANNAFLATAGSDPLSVAPGFHPTVLQDKILSNGASDANGASPDATVFWNFFHNWDYDDAVGAGAYDYKSTVTHELMHALGFISNIDAAGRGWNFAPSGTPDAWSVFDRFVVSADGTPLVNDANNSFNTALQAALTGNPGAFFGGPNAVAANGGQLVPLYSPSPFESASSIHHLDDAAFSSPDLIMESTVFTGPAPRELSAVEMGILSDLGYSVVPEPGTGLLLLLGLAVAWKRRCFS